MVKSEKLKFEEKKSGPRWKREDNELGEQGGETEI